MTVAAKKKSRAPAKVSAPKKAKLPAKEPVAPEPQQEPTQAPEKLALVAPLSEPVFRLVMQIIDNTDFKGREINNVIAVKMELARVAGLRQGDGQ